MWKFSEKRPFFRADMAGLGKYHMGGYGRIGVYRVKYYVDIGPLSRYYVDMYPLSRYCVDICLHIVTVRTAFTGS